MTRQLVEHLYQCADCRDDIRCDKFIRLLKPSEDSEIARLRQQLQQAQHDNQLVVCTYCGDIRQHADPAARFELMKDHILECAKHPMNRVAEVVEQETARLAAELEACRARCQRYEQALADISNEGRYYDGGWCSRIAEEALNVATVNPSLPTQSDTSR